MGKKTDTITALREGLKLTVAEKKSALSASTSKEKRVNRAA